MAAESATVRLFAGIRKDLKELKKQFIGAGSNRSKLEALKKLANDLLYDVPKAEDADLRTEIEGFLQDISHKSASATPDLKEEKKAASSDVASVTTGGQLFPEDFAQVDTPDDNSCLFWSAALGLLLPTLEDAAAFNNMYDRLFGAGPLPVDSHEDQDSTLLSIEAPDTKEAVQNILRTYDCGKNTPLEYKGDVLQTLVCKVFRGRVGGALSEAFPDAAAREPILVTAQLDDPRIANWEAYINKMREPTAWGGDAEIRAISYLAQVNISVASAGTENISVQFLGSTQTLHLAHVNAKNKKDGHNHYHYGLANVVYDRHTQEKRNQKYYAIQFLEGKRKYEMNDFEGALKILMKCYNFCKKEGGASALLLPVVAYLANVMEQKKNFAQHLKFLKEQLKIQRRLAFNETSIIGTKLRILNAYLPNATNIDDDWKYLELMKIEEQIASIPITKEDIDIGFVYFELAATRINFSLPPSSLSSKWSNIDRRAYHNKTLVTIEKARLHFNAATGEDARKVAGAIKHLDKLKKKHDELGELYQRPTLLGMPLPLHPADETEELILSTLNANENMGESSTLEYLAKLSMYSSEIDPMEVAEVDRVLTVAEFEKLPDEGAINPYRLRTAQGGINSTFRDGYILSILASDVELEPWKLYVKKLSDSTFEYRAIDSRGKPQNGIITERDMSDIKLVLKEPFTLANLKPVLSKIIKITSRRGHTTEEGRPLEAMRDSLIADPNYRVKIPPVEIGIHDGKVYSFDTRRLIVHMMAREKNPTVLVRYRKISGEYLQKRIYDDKIYSARPWNGFVTAIRYGGVNSPSEAYINPAVRRQLVGKVDKTFKPFPVDRKLAVADPKDDENGFPIAQKKSQKIHAFLGERAKKGSKRSAKVLKEAEKIADSKGKYAAYDYLLQRKASVLSGLNLEGEAMPAKGDGKAISSLRFAGKRAASSAAAVEMASVVADDTSGTSSRSSLPSSSISLVRAKNEGTPKVHDKNKDKDDVSNYESEEGSDASEFSEDGDQGLLDFLKEIEDEDIVVEAVQRKQDDSKRSTTAAVRGATSIPTSNISTSNSSGASSHAPPIVSSASTAPSHAFLSSTSNRTDASGRKIVSVGEEYRPMNEDLLPGWQHTGEKIGRHK